MLHRIARLRATFSQKAFFDWRLSDVLQRIALGRIRLPPEQIRQPLACPYSASKLSPCGDTRHRFQVVSSGVSRAGVLPKGRSTTSADLPVGKHENEETATSRLSRWATDPFARQVPGKTGRPYGAHPIGCSTKKVIAPAIKPTAANQAIFLKYQIKSIFSIPMAATPAAEPIISILPPVPAA